MEGLRRLLLQAREQHRALRHRRARGQDTPRTRVLDLLVGQGAQGLSGAQDFLSFCEVSGITALSSTAIPRSDSAAV
ncbi:hypothetical protein SBADM41S_01724 [Streptomyces badius]